MKNKHLPMIGLMLFLGCNISLAQPKADGAPTALVKGGFVKTAPQWSPQGDKLAFSTLNYEGIWVVDANGSNLEQVTSDPGSGYKLSWSEDGKTILARTSPRVDLKVFHEVKTYDVASKAETVLLKKTRDLKGIPSWSSDNSNIEYKLDGTLKRASTGKAALKSAKAETDAQLLVKKIQEDPANVATSVLGLKELSGRILYNAQASNTNRVVFEAGGRGIFVCDGDGSNLKHLGSGNAPAWTPDGKYVIVALTEDDGHAITKAVLSVVDVATGTYKALTDDSIIALRPSVAPTGDKVAFEELKSGAIYILKLKQ